MSQLKPGYERILQHIDCLASQPWLADSQRFWPRYIFHFTDIKNARSILTEGALFSRQRLLEMRKLDTDIANPEIIKATPGKWKNYVRLYFRPRTPTQFRNEGIRPKDKLYGGAHCPIPIVFIFDAKKILILQSSPFHARLEVIEVKTNKKYTWEQKDFSAREVLEFDLTNLECPDHYEVSFSLDDNLAYRNTYIEQPAVLF